MLKVLGLKKPVNDTKHAIAFIAVLLSCTAAFAAECGGETPCQCGDTVIQDVLLNESLFCNGSGIYIGTSNVQIDCKSNSIYHSANSSGYGIEISGKQNVTILNCKIINDAEAPGNSHGIYASSSRNVFIQNVSIESNSSGYIGILLENSSLSEIRHVDSMNMGNESHGIFLNSSSNNIFSEVILDSSGQDSCGIYIYASGGMNSTGNSFSNMTLSGNRVCSRSNFSENSCATGNYLTNPSGFDRNNVIFSDPGGLSPCNQIGLSWYVRANVSDISGKAIEGASLNITNGQNNTEEMGTTDSSGMTSWLTANDTVFSHDPAFEINYSLHSFDAYAYGFFPGFFNSKIDVTKTLDFVLNDSLAPEINFISAETDVISLNGSVKINASITDNTEVSSASFFVETPEGLHNITAEKGIDNEFYIICNSTNECNTNVTGQYNITSVWANDTSGNNASAESLSINFMVSEQDWMEISGAGANATSGIVNDSIMLSSSVTGSITIAEVRFFVQTPYGEINLTSTNDTASHFYIICNSTNECNTNMTGQYNLTSVWANNTEGDEKHENYDSISFLINYPPELEIIESGYANITTSSADIFLETSVNAICRHSSQDIGYESMESNFSTSGGKVHSSPISGLSPNTAYTYYARCVDYDGNETNASVSVSFTTNSPAPSNPVSYSGGGGGYSPAAPTPGKYIFSKMEEGAAYNISINDRSRGLKSIEIIVKSSSYGVSIYVTKISSQPSYVPQITGTKHYEWFNISKEKLEDSAIQSIKIRFNVTKAWLSENSLSPGDIFLYRYNKAWEKLPTSVKSQGPNEYEFESYSPGFSVFSIAGKKPQETITYQYCGNGILDSNEECDGSRIENYTCQFFGYDSGNLGCNKDCTISTENCSSAAMVRKTGSPASGKIISAIRPEGDFDLILAIIIVISIIVAISMSVYLIFFRK